MNVIFHLTSIEKVKKERKNYGSREYTDYIFYRYHSPKLENIFLSQGNVDTLRSAAVLRSLKLLVENKSTSPIISYYPNLSGKILKNSPFSKLLPTEINDGEHILDIGERFKLWLQKEVKAGKIMVKKKKFMAENESPFMLLTAQKSITIYDNSVFSFFSENDENVCRKPNLLPVDDSMGLISELFKERPPVISLNSMFFAMETTDMESIHTSFGQPYGLTINNGKVVTPPLFTRGAFFVKKNGTCEVKTVSVENIRFFIDEIHVVPGENCEIWRRPEAARTSFTHEDVDLVVINDKILSWKEGGDTEIPDAGFIIRVEKSMFKKFRKFRISFKYDDDIRFAVQGGPILVKDGEIQKNFGNEEFGGKVHYPPTVFPFDWDKTPAARIAIGNAGEDIVILAVEGCNRTPYVPGVDSRGFTLLEMATEMRKAGVENAVNLDGGGSMQVRLLGAKALKYADRHGIPYHEFERPVPAMITFE